MARQKKKKFELRLTLPNVRRAVVFFVIFFVWASSTVELGGSCWFISKSVMFLQDFE